MMAPLTKVNTAYKIGIQAASKILGKVTKPAGPKTIHPRIPKIGLRVCSIKLVASAKASLSLPGRMKLKTIPVIRIFITPTKRQIGKDRESFADPKAKNRFVTPKIRLDWVVKNAN